MWHVQQPPPNSESAAEMRNDGRSQVKDSRKNWAGRFRAKKLPDSWTEAVLKAFREPQRREGVLWGHREKQEDYCHFISAQSSFTSTCLLVESLMVKRDKSHVSIKDFDAHFEVLHSKCAKKLDGNSKIWKKILNFAEKFTSLVVYGFYQKQLMC